MIHISLYYDGRRLDANGCGRVRLMINNHSRTALLDTGVKVAPDQCELRRRAGHPRGGHQLRPRAQPRLRRHPRLYRHRPAQGRPGAPAGHRLRARGQMTKPRHRCRGTKQRCGNAERQGAQMRLFVHLRGVYLIRVRQQALGDVAERFRQLAALVLVQGRLLVPYRTPVKAFCQPFAGLFKILHSER